jgi:hypothetical protein
MQIPPLEVLNAWPAPNYINPVTRGYGNIYLNIVLYTIVNIFLGLRIFTRTRLAGTFGADDVFILIAWVCSIMSLYDLILCLIHL